MHSSGSLFLLPKEHGFARQFVTLRRGQADSWPHSIYSNRYLFSSARNAIFWSLKALEVGPQSRILAPSYICRAAIEPLRAYGAKVDFYAVTRDCQVDLADLECRIDARTRAVIAVHYFGLPQQMRGIKNLCDRFHISLIEDCAHVLQGDIEGRPMGTFGDASVFSWRKFLPTCDGGELVINRPAVGLDIKWKKEPFSLSFKIVKDMIENAASPLRFSALNSGMKAVQVLWSLVKHRMASQKKEIPFTQSDFFNEAEVNERMSRISRYVMAHSDLAGITKSRRANYAFLARELPSIDGIRVPFPDLPKGICPWIFPFFYEHTPDAHLILRRHGIPAVTWEGVRPPSLPRNMFPDAEFLYRHLVFLPVHQCLKRSELEIMVQVLKTTLPASGFMLRNTP